MTVSDLKNGVNLFSEKKNINIVNKELFEQITVSCKNAQNNAR